MRLLKNAREDYHYPKVVVCKNCKSEWGDLTDADMRFHPAYEEVSYDTSPATLSWRCEVCGRENSLDGVPEWYANYVGRQKGERSE